MIRVVGALIAVGLYIYFVIDVARTPRTEMRSLPKVVWLILVVVLPLLGGALWLLLGRTTGVRRRKRTLAPDDDPRVLRQIADQAWSERMKRRRGEQPN
ncbi:MAG: PLDc N-terminal domain-containing protein [Candidatus Nanopelagicales bacterium]|jgi:hypothetical protein|nr:PLDc N-terminal domain-containing protein [Candidatus Nanopelagicales bacterium]